MSAPPFEIAPDGALVAFLRRWGRALAVLPLRLCSGWSGAVGLVLVLVVVLCAVAPDLFTGQSPTALMPKDRLQPPSWAHLLGTDQLGRDLYSRVIHGAATACRVALTSVALAAACGLLLGLCAGYGRGLLDSMLILLCDAVVSLPMILFALAAVALIGASIDGLIMIIVIFTTPTYFRVVRSQVLVLRGAEYVKAARAMGASPPFVMFRHLVPNLMGPLLVLMAMDIPAVIALESGLSFLGQGVPPPTPNWGAILGDGYTYIRQAPHIILAGGLPIIVATLGFTFLGEAMRDVLDPRMATGRFGDQR
ncbi:ABC transporter permease [Zavarzinia sp.]|uniref:ABC transporter permease n=1 Tax=Zavarzinia sp. TaxID=2027920 RepID=UPI00356A5BD9